jgi:hypothetical protein
VIVGGIGSYILTRLQINEARKIAKAELLLQFDQRLSQYDAVHRALRPGGDWVDQSKPDTIHWADLDGYMGAFERLNGLIDDKIVDVNLAKRFYGYRLQNIVANKEIWRAKLQDENPAWEDFLSLCKKFSVRTPTL